MKKLLLALMLFIASFCAFAQEPSQSYEYLTIKQYTINNGYSIVEDKWGYSAQGGTLYSYKTFYAGCTYIVFGMSQDTDVQDVDMHLYYSDGTLYTKDNTTDKAAAVEITPLVNVTLKIVLTNYRSNTPNDRSLCRYFVAYK